MTCTLATSSTYRQKESVIGKIKVCSARKRIKSLTRVNTSMKPDAALPSVDPIRPSIIVWASSKRGYSRARNLGATIDPEVDDWSSASKKIDDARKDLETKSKGGDAQVYSDWKRTEAQLADIMAHFRAMTYGWRHPTAHYRQSFTDERAGQILEATKAFVQAVAEFLERPQGHQG